MKLEEGLQKHESIRRRPFENDPTFWVVVWRWTYLSNLTIADLLADDWEPA